jgi:alanine dehydrogenase
MDAPAGVVTAVNTPEAQATALAAADLVIGAILISTYDTPPMITRDDLRGMQPGAVIVDATCGYGPGYLPTAGPVQQPGDPPRLVDEILHVKLDALPALVPLTATDAYTTVAGPYLARLAVGWSGGKNVQVFPEIDLVDLCLPNRIGCRSR